MSMMLDMSRLTHNSFADLLDLPFHTFKEMYRLLKKRITEEQESK